MQDTYEIDVNDLSEECGGMFLILDSARHLGAPAGDAEIQVHIRDCETCFERHGDLV